MRSWIELTRTSVASFQLPRELGIVILAVAGGFLLHLIAHRVGRRMVHRVRWDQENAFFCRVRRITRLLLPLMAIQLAGPALHGLLGPQDSIARRLLALAIIGGVVHLTLIILSAVQHYVEQTYAVDVEDNYTARRIHTQVNVLKRSIGTLVILVAISLALMTIPSVRNLGASLLASAGFAGLAIGLAARPMLENLIAGMQIALTQPINIDDVVIVEGEWGWIEEIRTTYVVIRIWDERRLIVPLSKFLQEPFQNWTRRSAQILGTVFLHTDYTVSVPAVREQLQKIVRQCDKWDGRVCVLQVTNATDRTLELRALVSAANSPAAWDLRVYVREQLIDFLQREHPSCLPRTRFELPAFDALARHGGEGSHGGSPLAGPTRSPVTQVPELPRDANDMRAA